MPGAEPADYEYGRPMELDDQQQQSATAYYSPNNFPMGLTAEGYNRLQTGNTAASNLRVNRSPYLTAAWGDRPPHLEDNFGLTEGQTGIQGGSDGYTGDSFFNGYTSPTFTSSTSLRANPPLSTGSPRRAFTNHGGNSYFPNSRMAPSQSASFNPLPSTNSAQLIFAGPERSSFYPNARMASNQLPAFNPPLNTCSNQRAFTSQGGNSYYPNSRMAPNQSAGFNPSLHTSSAQLIFNGQERSSFCPDYRMTPSQPPAFPPLNTGPTQPTFTKQGSSFYPNSGIARSQLAIFNPHLHMASTRNNQLRTPAHSTPPDPKTCFSSFRITPSGHQVARNDPGQTSPSDFVQIRVQDNGSSSSALDEIIASQSLPESVQYATQSEMDQDYEEMFPVNDSKANTEPNMSGWMSDFMETMPYEKTYVGHKHTGEQYTGRASTEYHGDGSTTACSIDTTLEIEAFENSRKISNAIVDESDKQKLLRDAAITWAETFVPTGMISQHEKQEKKYVSNKVYAYHPRGCENYYYRSVVGDEVYVEHWANNKTRTGVWNHPGNEFPSRIFDEYPSDWSTNVDPNIAFSRNPQKQKELNDLRNQLCSRHNTSAEDRYKPADPDTRPSWQYHPGGIISTIDHGTVDVPRSSITRDSIMRVVSRISNPIFTGATCGGSFSFWGPNSRPPSERRQTTHISNKERRNALRRIKDLLDRTWNLPSMQLELHIVYCMFKECNSSPGFGQSPYLCVKLATFDKFPKLPTELQWMIWEYCFPSKTEHLGLVVTTGNLRNEDHKIELPITLSICRQTRELTQRYYTIVDKPKFRRGSRYIYQSQVTYDKRKQKYSQPRQLALGPQDAVAISDDTPENRMETTLEWYNQINEKHSKGLQSIRHLEIRDIRNSHGDLLAASRRINSNADRSRLIPRVFSNGSLAMFKNLQTLTLTNMPPPAINFLGPQPFRREEQEVLKNLISDYLDQTRIGDDRLVAKENIKIRDFTSMEGQKVKKDNGRMDFNEEFHSKMLTHLPEKYQN
ncbi:uncharacterized protein EAF01_008748 [Botrytis porri]|uniref:uncharacterized protein n=1 Tax=Botrytis porri TaxID=87229 RepID=UPI00190071A8|nr:uncharacterized protein EAF01_008748 [Botrytis porri]KAF7897782.1 hypothetical protein EAF01_008748 [Botrytis porri]